MPANADKSALFIFAWRALAPDSAQDAIEWTPEFQFHETRKWRFDWAYPERKIAVEVSGGQWQAHGGRHSRDGDRDKRNYAAADGWVLFEFSTQRLENDPSACIALVLMGLGMASGAIRSVSNE